MAEVTEETMAQEVAQSTEHNATDEPIEEPIENKQYEAQQVPMDEYIAWYANLGYDPVSYCWRWKTPEKDGTFSTDEDGNLYNIPQLQCAYHFEGTVTEETLITYEAPTDSEATEPPCPPDSEIQKVRDVWRLVKWPPQTWDVITDDLNAWLQFEQMDENFDGQVSTEECRTYWQRKGLKKADIDKKVEEIKRCDKDGDGKISFQEFKTRFNTPNEVFFNEDFKIRLARWGFVIVLPIFILIILNIAPETQISVLIGISIQFMYMIYFATLGYYFWKGSNVKGNVETDNYLFRVFSRPGKAVIPEGNWAPLSMAINQVAWPLKPIHSVSEFSAVDGAIPAVMLSNIGQYTWAMVTVHFMIQIIIDPDFEWYFSDICEIIGVAGLVMLGVFEADPYNPSVTKFHMVGAFMGFGTALGYVTQNFENRGTGLDEDEQGTRNSLAWLLVVLFIVFYTLWNIILSMCFFEEARAFGMYDEENVAMAKEIWAKEAAREAAADGQEEPADDVDMECSGTDCCIFIVVLMVLICCICTGFPLLIFIGFYGPYKMYQKGKQKKRIKDRGPKHYQKFVFDFQPALPNWGDFVTPQIKKRITAFSVANVMFEGIVLLVGSTALSLYLMSYERECDGVCADQMFMLLFLIAVCILGVIGSYGLLFGGGKFGGGILGIN